MNAASPLGASLTAAAPDFPPELAADLVLRHFGLRGTLRALPSERDVNYHLASADGGYVVKLSNPAEPAEITDFQTRALLHLQNSDLPVPRVIRTLSGAAEVPLPQGVLRVLTYLEGQPLHRAIPSPALRRAMGQMAARLTLGLQGFAHPAANHVLQWDIKQAAALRPLLADLPDDLQALGAATLARFETEISPRLPDLRWQVVHSDLNPHNVLTDSEGTAVTGVLDFGDMVRTPLICDMAIAASYLVDPAAPLASLIDFAAAYNATLPLTKTEAGLLLPLTETRWLTTLCISAHRAARSPQPAECYLYPAQRPCRACGPAGHRQT